MLMINKKNGKTYELTNQPNEQGICQVYCSETNQVMLMRFDELEFWKTNEMRRRLDELKAAYAEGTRM